MSRFKIHLNESGDYGLSQDSDNLVSLNGQDITYEDYVELRDNKHLYKVDKGVIRDKKGKKRFDLNES